MTEEAETPRVSSSAPPLDSPRPSVDGYFWTAPLRRRSGRRRASGRGADLLAALGGLGLGITIVLAIGAESSGSLHAAGGPLTALGRLTGLIAAYLMLVTVLLVARIPALDRAVGLDRLTAWHRRLGPWRR